MCVATIKSTSDTSQYKMVMPECVSLNNSNRRDEYESCSFSHWEGVEHKRPVPSIPQPPNLKIKMLLLLYVDSQVHMIAQPWGVVRHHGVGLSHEQHPRNNSQPQPRRRSRCLLPAQNPAQHPSKQCAAQEAARQPQRARSTRGSTQSRRGIATTTSTTGTSSVLLRPQECSVA